MIVETRQGTLGYAGIVIGLLATDDLAICENCYLVGASEV